MKHINLITKDGKRFSAWMAEKGDSKTDGLGREHKLESGEVFFDNWKSSAVFGKVENGIISASGLGALNLLEVIAPDRTDIREKYLAMIKIGKKPQAQIDFEIE